MTMNLQDVIEAGAACRKARDFRAAADLYRCALELDSLHAQALKGLADAYRGLRELELCVETWDRYLASHPGDPAIQTRVGDACRRTGRKERAVVHYQAALRHNPLDRHALMGLGDLCQRENRPEEALACWEKLLALDPNLLNIRTMAGNLYRKKFDFARAEVHFREALRLEPGNAYAVFGLADALRGLGRFEEAARYWDDILQQDPGNLQVLTRAGDCFARLSQLDKAEGLLRRALEPGHDRSALLGLARVQALRGNHAEAIRCHEAILARNPKDTRARLLQAQAKAAAKAPALRDSALGLAADGDVDEGP